MKLKAYIGGQLFVSKSVNRPEELHDAFIEIQKLNPSKIYLSKNSCSTELPPLSKQPPSRPPTHTRPDGTVSFTISIIEELIKKGYSISNGKVTKYPSGRFAK